MKNERKLYKCNPEITQIAEWCIAKNKVEAYNFMDKFWDDGAIMKNMYANDYLKENPTKTLHDFIDIFFIEENPESYFTHPYAGINDEPITKKVKDWINEVDTVPCYLCHEKW